MARARGEKQYIALTKGLFTEASPLAAPEGTSSYELNMQIDTEGGARVRRNGLISRSNINLTDKLATGGFYWEGENLIIFTYWSDDPDTDYDTVFIHFFEGDAPYNGVAVYQFRVFEDSAARPSITEIRNRLVFSFGANPFVFERRNDEFNAWYLDLYVRDFKLVEDGLSISNRPASLNDEHKYNLYNAGWYKNQRLKSSGVTGDPITEFNSVKSVYPSNADIVSLMKVANTDGIEEFDPDLADNFDLGNTEAPRGHYVYNILDINRTNKLTNKAQDGTPSTVLTQVLDQGTNGS